MAIIEFIIIWLFIGTWICRKRNWYSSLDSEDRPFASAFAIILMPIALIMAFIREFITRDWDYFK